MLVQVYHILSKFDISTHISLSLQFNCPSMRSPINFIFKFPFITKFKIQINKNCDVKMKFMNNWI